MSSYEARSGGGGGSGGDALVENLSMRLREAEARRADCERAHREVLAQLRSSSGRPGDPLDHLHSRARELDKKVIEESLKYHD